MEGSVSSASGSTTNSVAKGDGTESFFEMSLYMILLTLHPVI
jgi:hypothetical protein